MNTNKSFVFTSLLITGLLATPLTYGQEAVSFAKWGKYGHDVGGFNQPSSIAVTPSGNVLVADTGNNRIVSFNVDYAINQTTRWLSENITINNPNLHVREIATDLQFPTAIAFFT